MERAQLFGLLPRNGSGSISRLMVIVDEDDDDLGCPSPASSSESSAPSSPATPAGGGSSSGSFSSDLTDDATSSPASQASGGSPLDEMSELMEDLPVKRGLSRHFNGKSQSFTSLANARCLQDLVKPMRKPPPSTKPMRSCRSYAAGLDGTNNHHHQLAANPHSPKGTIAKRPARNASTGLFHHHAASRPPMHPHGSGNLAGQAMLFA